MKKGEEQELYEEDVVKKWVQMKDALIRGSLDEGAPQPLAPPQPLVNIDVSIYHTRDVTVLFKMINGLRCLMPTFPNHKTIFSINAPFSHPVRKKIVHDWLQHIGTFKYLDIIEDVKINAQRLEQISVGATPMAIWTGEEDEQKQRHLYEQHLGKRNTDLLHVVEKERQDGVCPLIHFRKLKNGLYAAVNVNDFDRIMFDRNPLV